MSKFNGSDYEFAAGAIKGLRSWKADDQGRLRGVTHPAIWLPGENIADCKQNGGHYEPCPAVERDVWMYSFGSTCDDPTCTSNGHFVAATETHSFDASCECGFWAYDEYGFKPHGDVVGIIEGYGKTTIGTKGFRCEKARIVALSREWGPASGHMTLSLWLRLRQLYPDAKFYEKYDDMVTAHGAVVRAWDAVGEDFWNPPDEPREDPYASYHSRLSALTSQMAALSAPSRFKWMP
jgi:hypothetical protein